MMMPVMKMSMATAKMTMSCGQKSWPRMENRRSTMFIMSSGLPLILMNGPVNMMPMSSQLTQVRRCVHLPCGSLA